MAKTYSVKLERVTTEACVIEVEAPSRSAAAFKAASETQSWEVKSAETKVVSVDVEE